MKTQSNIFRITFFAALLLVGSIVPAYADGAKRGKMAKENTAATHNISKEIRQVIEGPSMSGFAQLSGEAEVHFSVDEHMQVQVKGVFATSEALADYVEGRLNGTLLKRKGAVPGQEYRVKVRFVDLR